MNDEAGIFFTMLLLGIIGMVVTGLVKDQHIAPIHYEWASEACALNGGLRTLGADVEDLSAQCKNGALFESTKPRLEGK